MMLNVTADIYTEKSMNTVFFNLNLDSLDIDLIKSSILERLKIDKTKVLKEGIKPEKDIKNNIRYWVQIEK